MLTRLKGVHIVKKRLADGSIKLFYYHRATRIRLEGEPGSPEFITSFAAAEKLVSDRHAGTFNSLVRDYTLSIEFQKLRESTKRQYRRMLTTAETKFGTMPIPALNEPEVKQVFLTWRDKVADKAREADHRLAAISAMLSWAVKRGKIQTNHLKGFDRLHHADRSDIIWEPEHIDAFMAVAPIEMQQALILGKETGQREGDLLVLPWSAYDGMTIRLKQSKTGMAVIVPCTAELKQMLDGMERKTITILTSATGRPWEQLTFIQTFKRWKRKAGLSGLRFHDLRGTCVTRLAEAGCTIPEIAAITGHTLASVHKIVEKYLARTATLAHNAIAKLENANRTKVVN